MTTTKQAVDGRNVNWPTLAVIGGFLLVAGAGLQIGRNLERQDTLSTAQAEANTDRQNLRDTMNRVEGKVDALTQMMTKVPTLEARMIALEGEIARQERERRLLQDTVERKLAVDTRGGSDERRRP